MSDATTVRRALAQAGLAPIDAQSLLSHVLSCDRAWLVAHATDPLTTDQTHAFFALARRRREGEPVAYLTGVREFFGLPLAVDRSVLIPRPETETLVERALRALPADRPLHVLDLGTGSGAIALAIAHARPRASVVAIDNSADALAVARGNAARLRVSNVEWLRADWFDALGSERFDAIVSNPPYVAAGDPHLAEGDVRFEPPQALASGPDGLAALRVIVAGARDHLASGGWLAVEHGYDQAVAVRDLLQQAGFRRLESLRDLSGIPRVAAGRNA
ncbi:MAG TPA: peptide chain release factor N(5)-glutamine methyltransferase [Casimicrobiaceae bacterium]|nr:peptide chain release factor N(5)-glutamine methyltransferase [Casimicrobiaceae bacterium]